MRENPEQTAWRKKNMSYPEKVFKDTVYDLGLNNKFLIEREYSVFPYFIDYAFINEKVAVEIDGEQHNLPERKINDKKKDELLINHGWRVYRITAKKMIDEPKKVMKNLIEFIGTSKTKDNCGVIKHVSKKYTPLREDGKKTEKEIKSYIKQRKIKRPPYNKLIKEIEELGYVGIGKKYKVSDNAIRKWKKFYENYK